MQNKIAEFRNALNLSQRQLAANLSIPYQHLQRWERGIVVPAVDTAIRIARALGTTVEELFILEDEE